MAEPFLAELRIFSFNFAPRGWAQCNGQLLPINQNQALFSLLGTTYGGDGVRTFGLPNLQGRVPMHFGNGFTQGQLGGEESHTLTISEVPAHTHVPAGSGNNGNLTSASGNVWGTNGSNPFATTANTTLDASTIKAAGGSQPHENRGPFLALNIAIALQGIFPSRN